jgi:hypothetical protein
MVVFCSSAAVFVPQTCLALICDAPATTLRGMARMGRFLSFAPVPTTRKAAQKVRLNSVAPLLPVLYRPALGMPAVSRYGGAAPQDTR